ncbi:heme exporter protein CcmB [Moraxella sp.]|uniref:heme exporter protein CcmB n=1 Tax=Moraxella sp. TaxID=479 RepID=UPI002630D032|nr:heme exporter protein CcmB [Moraxella sp.]MCP3897563.1 heme exporter protein CcmB [Moraxella sp.]
MGSLLFIIKRDLILSFRNLNELINPILFFIIVVSMFPLGIGSESTILGKIAPGIIWVAALLSTLLSLDGIFKGDYDDGSLEQIILSPREFSLMVLGKIIAHWLVAGLPLILVAPLLGVLLFLPESAQGTLIISLLLGTPSLSLIGAIGVGLIVGLKRSGVLLSLLILPLYVPVLIIGTLAVHDAAADLPVIGYFYALGAILILALTLAPVATAAAVRISIE